MKLSDKLLLEQREKVKIENMSTSSVSSYLTCGLQWYLFRVKKLEPISMSANLAFGTAFHGTVEPFWLGKPDQNFLKKWKSYKSVSLTYDKNGKENWQTFGERGKKMVDALRSTLKGKFKPSASRVEVWENVDLGFCTLRRRIDLITKAVKMPALMDGDMTELDGEVLFDAKTSRGQYNPFDVMASDQLKTYAIPAKGDKKRLETPSAYIVVTKSVQPIVQVIGSTFKKYQIDEQIERIKYATDGIRAGRFVQRESDACNWCDAKAICFRLPGWQSQYRLSKYRSRPGTGDGVSSK